MLPVLLATSCIYWNVSEFIKLDSPIFHGPVNGSKFNNISKRAVCGQEHSPFILTIFFR
jgi:hypothetical protein